MVSADPGSFRDPASHVVYDGDRVIRLLDERGLIAWNHLSASSFFKTATAAGQLIDSKQLDSTPFAAAGAVEHPLLPFISYPYEWTFSMLKDAALLQLDLLRDALSDGITIKDATPFNIQFVAGKPVFIDIGSFEPYSAGEPWIGYRQFTRQFLFPLLLIAWMDIPFQPRLRGDMEGPTAHEMKKLLSFGKRMRPSALMHVTLQANMEKRMSGAAVRADLKTAGFSSDLILTNVRKLRKLVESLTWEVGTDGWIDYETCDHVGRDRKTKGEFLRSVLASGDAKQVVDLGANDGYFTRIAASSGAHAIAVDGDQPVLDQLYRHSVGEDISIVVSDITNPTPSQGWAGSERPGLFERAKPDLIVAYGVIHHLTYTSSIPPASVLDWLRSFESTVALEFVDPTDDMVAMLTANKLEQELHPGRFESEFRELLSSRFRVEAEQPLEGGTRILFHLRPA